MKTTPDGTALIMTLYNGKSYNELEEKNINPDSRKYPSRKDVFKEQSIVISLVGFDLERSQDGLFKSYAAMKNISQLTFYIDSLNKKYNEKRALQFKEYNTVKIYNQRNFQVSPYGPKGKTDSLKKLVIFDTRVLYDSLSTVDKRTVLTKAIESLKDGNSFMAQINESDHFDIKFIKKFEVEWNKKLTMSFACIVFFLIGAPLGAIIRKGGLGTPSVISIFFFVIYYVISISGQKMVEEDVIGTFAGMWAASYILLPIGIFLTYKATTDSVIMNIDTYLMFFKKIKDYLFRISIIKNAENSVSD
jgi:lipopolysaccharide export system permease protein